jgi:hypothetical protein
MTRENDPLKQTPICELDRDNRAMTRESEMTRATLEIDPTRLARDGETGIYVRAVQRKDDGDRLLSCDIVCLTRESLLNWLRSRGGKNPWAEECVALLLGHEPVEVAALLEGELE